VSAKNWLIITSDHFLIFITVIYASSELSERHKMIIMNYICAR
jgi:hypothetical protein